MTTSGVELFLDQLADAFDISPPAVKFSTPINNDAQYSPVRSQIQYRDTQEMIHDLTEGDSIAPLRWTLHEFAHHVQDEHGQPLSEADARWFTDELVEVLVDEWQAAVVNEKRPTVSLEAARYKEHLID